MCIKEIGLLDQKVFTILGSKMNLIFKIKKLKKIRGGGEGGYMTIK